MGLQNGLARALRRSILFLDRRGSFGGVVFPLLVQHLLTEGGGGDVVVSLADGRRVHGRLRPFAVRFGFDAQRTSFSGMVRCQDVSRWGRRFLRSEGLDENDPVLHRLRAECLQFADRSVSRLQLDDGGSGFE